MNSVVFRRALPQLRLLYQVRTAGYWNKDWQPGPRPETPEEQAAAAKKYNLLPEEYKPYPEGDGLCEPGDYPNLPEISGDNKDVYIPWDLPDEKRNFGEPIHVHGAVHNVNGEARCDTHAREKLKYTPLQMFLALVGALLTVYSAGFCPFPFFPPVAARHMPRPGVVHYSYEPVE